MLSILTPAFNESTNLVMLHERIVSTMTHVGGEWEWLIVDDHSRDETFAVVERLAREDSRVRGIRLSRNSGSHVAISCGLHHVRGDVAVMMAADLQDPPETLGTMVERWRSGAQVVWAMRRPGRASQTRLSAAYYWIMRHVVGTFPVSPHSADVVVARELVATLLAAVDVPAVDSISE